MNNLPQKQAIQKTTFYKSRHKYDQVYSSLNLKYEPTHSL